MKPTIHAIVLALLMLTSAIASMGFFSSAYANPEGAFLQLSMPIEHINYTITEINGTLWVKIDGNYPISIQNKQGCDVLPVLYPMPPQTTNIHITLNGQELEWSNCTQSYPELLHQTAIGDWWIISSVIENVSDSFLLEIHYEHPLERVNGSYVFLYDLNILDYLSEENPTSTAYFTVRFETKVSDVQAYTAPVDSTASNWQPKNFTITNEGYVNIVSVEMYSKYATPLLGDLVVIFSEGDKDVAENSDGESVWIIPVLIDVVLISIVVYIKRKTIGSVFSSRKSAV